MARSNWSKERFYAIEATDRKISRAQKSGMCVVCGNKSQALYPDGARSLTCLTNFCFYTWLPGGEKTVSAIKSGEIEIGPVYD